MKIIKLEASNILRLRAIQITPDGELVVIGGKNSQGKTSTINAIAMALKGGRAIPQKPVHEGERTGEIVCDLGGLIVERTIKPDRKTVLVVKNKNGEPQKSPQAILDRLVGELTFDPLEFVRSDPSDQVETLRKLVGVDFAAFDSKRSELYEERKQANRDAKRLEVEFEGADRYPNTPPNEVSIQELTAEFERAQKEHADLDKMKETETTRSQAIAKLGLSVETMRRDLEEKEQKLSAAKENFVALQKGIIEMAESLSDIETVRIQLNEAEEVNSHVRANKARADLSEKVDAAQDRSKELTASIEQIDREKKEAIAAANFPVEGLAFDEGGVLFNDMPFDQAGDAEKIRVSLAMGMALNPTLRVLLIRDGSLLDDDSLKLVSELAKGNDYQCWIERVGEGEEVSVVIEDGVVK